MIEEPSRNDSEELASLRKRRRLALYLAESGRLPDAFALTFDPPFTAKQLPALATLCETRGFKDKCFYEYSNRGYATIEWKRDLTNTGEIKTGKVTDLASLALKEGKAYMMSVDTVVDQLKKRELREQERYLVEGLARMEMIEVKREKEADSLRESLLEWMEDAETLVKLNDWDSFFSVVSKIHKDEDVFDSKMLSFSFATRFAGLEYSITVEMPNASEVRAISFPHLKGLKDVIEGALTTFSLLDAIIGQFWMLARLAE